MALKMRNELATVKLEALRASADKAIEWKEGDDKMILVIVATEESNVTIKAGNGIQGVADMVLTVPVGTSLVKLESGRFKNVSGENKGKIVIQSNKTPNVGAVAIV